MIDGIPALQISNEIVPDFEMAKTDLNNIFFLIFSSETISQFFKSELDMYNIYLVDKY